MQAAIHISHEAAKKIGGIGAVLSGLCNSKSYQSEYHKTIFYGPLFDETSSKSPDRLGKKGKVLFSSLDGINGNYPELASICEEFHVDIVYGIKAVYDEIHPDKSVDVEIILVGIRRLKVDLINKFKFRLWESFKFQSESYSDWDYEQYIRIAVPFDRIIDLICRDQTGITAFAHEYMGVPCCLKYIMDQDRYSRKCKTYFYAHEVSTARSIVEKIPGHDFSFYNLMDRDLPQNMSLEDRFGSQKHNYRNELIKLALHFDGILAVGDWVEKEYLYLTGMEGDNKNQQSSKIRIVYNGIPVEEIDWKHRLDSRDKMIQYCERLFNFSPDIIFTHVTRLVVSKGLWRDVRFLEEMDTYFTENKLKGFYVLLSSLIATGRTPEEILKMENEYGWPVLHKEGYPDLIDYEKDIYNSISLYNAKSRSIKAVFVNQYGFSRETTGLRIPENTGFYDIRCGSDVELGFSVYEPFGIAQIESIPSGGLAYLSRHCGCSYLLEECFAETEHKPFYIVDFTKVKHDSQYHNDSLKNLTAAERSEIEADIFKSNGRKMFELLPKSDEERKMLFEQAIRYARSLSWENRLSDL